MDFCRTFRQRLGRHRLGTRLCLAAPAMLLGAVAVAAASGLTGKPAPDFALKSTGGQNLRLSEYRGQPVLVTFWAAWCGRCADQLRALDELSARSGSAGFRVLAVNIDANPGPARDAAARLTIPVLLDADQAVARQYDLADLPFAILVDADGTVRHVHEKYRQGDDATYADEMANLVGE